LAWRPLGIVWRAAHQHDRPDCDASGQLAADRELGDDVTDELEYRRTASRPGATAAHPDTPGLREALLQREQLAALYPPRLAQCGPLEVGVGPLKGRVCGSAGDRE
jgi:hypothetical protein